MSSYVDHTILHTPGPWYAYEEMLTPGGLHVTGRMPMVRKNGHIIAHIGRFLNHRLNDHVCQEAEANGRLISKAPEMVAYINRCAKLGDQEAVEILLSIVRAGKPADGGHIVDPDMCFNR